MWMLRKCSAVDSSHDWFRSTDHFNRTSCTCQEIKKIKTILQPADMLAGMSGNSGEFHIDSSS